MDFDFPLPPDLPGPDAQRTVGDHIAGLLAWMVFPLVDFLMVSEMLDPSVSYTIPALLLPGGFAVLTYAIGRRFGGRSLFVAVMAVLCAMTCFLASAAGAFSSAFL